MAILVMILRKMIKNKWMEMGLLCGLILSVALVSSMPIYTEAILQRMLVKQLENKQIENNQYPTIHWSAAYLYPETDQEASASYFHPMDQYISEQAYDTFNLPVLQHVLERATDRHKLVPVDPNRVDPEQRRFADVAALSNLEEHIRLVDGRLPANETVDGTYEALVPEGALSELHMVLGNEFIIESESEDPIIIKPVGVVDKKSHDDLYWYTGNINNYRGTFFIPFDLFEEDFTKDGKLSVVSSYWYTVLDYKGMNISHIADFFSAHNRIESKLNQSFHDYGVNAPVLNTLAEYYAKEKKLRILLWSLNVPILIMLGLYLFMVSNLIIDRQKQEIAVLRSRGCARYQIMLIYLLEGLILGAIALFIGPYVGLMLTKALGASNGFLEFVQRAVLPAHLDAKAYKYALITVISAQVMMLIPVFNATKISIVMHKQKMARRNKSSILHRFYIDVILLVVSYYGLRTFNQRMEDVSSLGLDSTTVQIDPLLFLVPALFILGAGLFILRIYPLFIRFVHWLGKRWWPSSLYATLIQVGRSSSQYQFLMVFLIMTMAIGLFSASAARTINQNNEEKILYRNGADIVLNTLWENNAPISYDFDVDGLDGGESEGEAAPASASIEPTKIQYSEPPFQPFKELPGVEHAAKVFVKEEASYSLQKEKGKTILVGIETNQFGQTAWFRDKLLDYHFFEYLNLISVHPSAVLISRTMAEKNGIQVGDSIDVGWYGLDEKTFTVYGVIDYFPTFNPNSAEKSDGSHMLVVGHLEYIQNNLALEPYEIWMKLKLGASRKELYDAIEERELRITDFADSQEAIITSKNDPYHLAINGVMTLGFIISLVICFFGFLLYWILSLYSRVLQTGVFRAMGISFTQIIGMLIVEQLLTSGAAIVIGMMTGMIASQLFVPMFQLSFDMASQVPPFMVVNDPNDARRLYIIVLGMIGLGLVILGHLLSRIKIHQAVKLGED